MRKNIQLLFLIVFLLSFATHAQENSKTNATAIPMVNGYYQKIDLNPETPCGCDQKTQRTYDLAKGLRPNDVLDYNLHAFSFSFGTNTSAASKLFKAFEADLSIYKVSMKEWSAFMLLTTRDFDVVSFEKAAKNVFATITSMTPEDFLKIKNTSSYYEYIQALEEFKLQQQQHTNPTKN